MTKASAQAEAFFLIPLKKRQRTTNRPSAPYAGKLCTRVSLSPVVSLPVVPPPTSS